MDPVTNTVAPVPRHHDIDAYFGARLISERERIFNLPKRMFQWIYSISLVIFIILMLAFVAVTPLDVIVQVSSTSNSAIKMLIVIIVCVVFIVCSLVAYFLRVYQYRLSLNDIPLRSVYIPHEGDMPRAVSHEIDNTLTKCMEIRLKATPLQNNRVIINNRGMAPPEYIQRRNEQLLSSGSDVLPHPTGTGTSLPPNAVYEDVIRSISDKFIFQSKMLTQVEVPTCYTFREVIIYLSQTYLYDVEVPADKVPDLQHMVELYHKFRFGPHLIAEQDLLEFMVEFDKLGQICLSNFTSKIHSRAPKKKNSDVSAIHGAFENVSRGEASDYDEESDDYQEDWKFPAPVNYDTESYVSTRRPRYSTTSSSRSVIKKKLALSNPSLDIKWDDSENESVMRNSGYDTDEEEDDADIYGFRKGNREL